jgi:hypothetical protein
LVIYFIVAALGMMMMPFLFRARWDYMVWFIIYLILGIPVFYLILPTYSFFHMDDFGWGLTREVAPNTSDPETKEIPTGDADADELVKIKEDEDDPKFLDTSGLTSRTGISLSTDVEGSPTPDAQGSPDLDNEGERERVSLPSESAGTPKLDNSSKSAKKKRSKTVKKRKEDPVGKSFEKGKRDSKVLTSSDSASLRRPREREKSKKGKKVKKEKQQGGGQDNVPILTGTMKTETKSMESDRKKVDGQSYAPSLRATEESDSKVDRQDDASSPRSTKGLSKSKKSQQKKFGDAPSLSVAKESETEPTESEKKSKKFKKIKQVKTKD